MLRRTSPSFPDFPGTASRCITSAQRKESSTRLYGVPYHVIEAGKMRRYASAKNISDIFKILKGYGQAKKILRGPPGRILFLPRAVFVSVPVAWAAAKLRNPGHSARKRLSPGLTNLLCTKKAQKICLSFDTRGSGGRQRDSDRFPDPQRPSDRQPGRRSEKLGV